MSGNTPEGGGPVGASSVKTGHAFPGALASACLWLAFKNLSEKKKTEAKQSPWVGMRGPRRAPGMKGGWFSRSASPLCLESPQVSRELLTPAELAKFLLHFGAL